MERRARGISLVKLTPQVVKAATLEVSMYLKVVHTRIHHYDNTHVCIPALWHHCHLLWVLFQRLAPLSPLLTNEVLCGACIWQVIRRILIVVMIPKPSSPLENIRKMILVGFLTASVSHQIEIIISTILMKRGLCLTAHLAALMQKSKCIRLETATKPSQPPSHSAFFQS